MPDCIFCKIVAKEVPVIPVYEDARVMVIHDVNPQAPVHLLAITKEHFAGIHEVPEEKLGLLGQLYEAIGTVVRKKRLEEQGYRLVVNFGEKGGQTVPHIHVHILSGRTLHWPPG